MKKLYSFLSAIIVIALLISCSKDDDEPTLSFTKELIIGQWKITNISKNITIDGFSIGAEAEFKADGTCIGWFNMEDAYKIKNGRIHTYYATTDEPMFIYTLLSKNGESLSVKVKGTLDDNRELTLTIQKMN